jgi:hypothetical protein
MEGHPKTGSREGGGKTDCQKQGINLAVHREISWIRYLYILCNRPSTQIHFSIGLSFEIQITSSVENIWLRRRTFDGYANTKHFLHLFMELTRNLFASVVFVVISRGYYRWSGIKLLELFPCGDSLTLETFSKEWPQDCNFRGTL